jgi:hypothetical protein
MPNHPETAGTRAVLAAVLAVTAVLVLLVTAFAWPASRLAPHHLPVAVAGDARAAGQVQGQLDHALGPGAFEVSAVPDRAAAVEAVTDRDVYGALVPRPTGLEVLTASAASPVVAQLLGELGNRIGAATHTTPAVTDVVPLPAQDPHGAVFAAGSLPLVIGGIATAAVLALLVRSRARRFAAAVAVAALAGLSVAAVLQPWLGALQGSYLANAAVLATGVGAMALALLGLHNVLGLPGLGLGAAALLLLGNPLSGVTSAPDLLPPGWSALGQVLPPGALGSALRSTSFFAGAGATGPLLVLAVWLLAGGLLVLAPGRGTRTEAVLQPVSEAGSAA